MAITGFVMFGFVTGHLLGNLQVFMEPVKINTYAHFLESLGELLWLVRGFLLVCLVVHVWVALQLVLENRAARPAPYAMLRTNRATLASRVMGRTGIVVLAFIIYHLADFTLRVQHPEWGERTFRLADGTMVRDVHAMIVHSFSRVGVSAFYIIAIGLLSYHLSHGLVSMFQSVGWKNERWSLGLGRFAVIYCWLYFLLNAAIPVAVLTGFVHA